MIISAPISTLFVIFQILTIMQYFLNKRIDSLKDLTWSLYDVKHEKMTNKMDKRSEKLKTINKKTSRRASISKSKRSSTKNIVNEIDIDSIKKLSSSKKELLSPKTRNESDFLPVDQENSLPKESKKSDLETNDSPREFTNTEDNETEITSTERYSVDLDPEDLEILRKIMFKMKVAKFFTSNFFKVIAVVFGYGLVILGQILINSVLEFVTMPNLCTFETMPYYNGISSLIGPPTIFIYLMIYLGLLLADVLLYIKENGFKVKLYFTLDDPFRFRIEMFLDIIILTIAFFISFTTIILNVLTIRVTVSQVNSLRGELSGISLALFTIFMEWFVILAMGGIPLLFAIVSVIRRKLQPIVYDTEFDAFINSKEGKQIFKKYAKKEWSLENILFYEEVEKFKKIWSMKYAKKRAEEISRNYIEVGSTLEVNMSGESRRTTIKKVKNFKQYKDEYKTIFDDAIKETKRNMRDTYSRIKRTLEFSIWQKSSKAMSQIDNSDTVQ